jgi:hypothetical protein
MSPFIAKRTWMTRSEQRYGSAGAPIGAGVKCDQLLCRTFVFPQVRELSVTPCTGGWIFRSLLPSRRIQCR